MSVNVIHTEFAALLRRVGMTQAMFAELSGVTAMAVNHWCRGRRPVPRWAWALANASGLVPLDDLLSFPAFEWHEVLGVSPGCDLRAASAARTRLAKRYRPDAEGDAGAMQRINAAFEVAKRLRG